MMRLSEAIKILQANTMACWWPSSTMGRTETDVAGIAGEVRALRAGIKSRQGIPADALFYVLDPNDPETRLFENLREAVQTLRRSIPRRC
jgi:hypothetical protein